jgi:phospholipid/cholesterol/gamma-HCH transport system ATP-binding protein
MLKHIVGLLAPDEGEVWFEEQRVDHLKRRELMEVRKQIGFLFQQGALFDSLTNLENVAFPLREHTKLSKADAEGRAQQMLEMVGLPDVGRKMPSQVSGGQRKRVALARSVVMEPKVILYDEPTTGLDPIRSDVISEVILKLRRELDVTSIVVTHDMANAMKVADRIVMLHDGRVRFDGTADEVRASEDPIVSRFVRGEADERELGSLQHDPSMRRPRLTMSS